MKILYTAITAVLLVSIMSLGVTVADNSRDTSKTTTIDFTILDVDTNLIDKNTTYMKNNLNYNYEYMKSFTGLFVNDQFVTNDYFTYNNLSSYQLVDENGNIPNGLPTTKKYYKVNTLTGDTNLSKNAYSLKNELVINLTGKTEISPNIYRLESKSNLTIDYNTNDFTIIINGVSTSANNSSIFKNIISSTQYTLTYIYESGTLSAGNFSIIYYDPYTTVIGRSSSNYTTNTNVTNTTSTQNNLAIEWGNGTTFNNLTFKLQLEQGSTSTVYQDPQKPNLVYDISQMITDKQYSPLYNTTFDLMTDAQIKAQMDEWDLETHFFTVKDNDGKTYIFVYNDGKLYLPSAYAYENNDQVSLRFITDETPSALWKPLVFLIPIAFASLILYFLLKKEFEK